MRDGYDNNLALKLANACQLAYDQFEKGSLPPPPAGYQFRAEFTGTLLNKTEKIGFLMTSAADHILAFRGTVSYLDWLADATYKQTTCDFADNAGQVHEGFKELYQSARGQILAALGSAKASLPLYITGHSLGGGLSTLAGLDIALNTPFTQPVVYSIASPRVGDPAFAKRFNDVVQTDWRILNTYDVVPLLPPEEIFDGKETLHYQHVDEWMHITFLNGFFKENHALANYVAKMKTLLMEECAAPLLENGK